MPDVYTRQCVVLIVAGFDACKVSIRRSFVDRLLYIAAEYKPLIALSLARILSPGSFFIERIVLNNTL
jgi:hypothetical protein